MSAHTLAVAVVGAGLIGQRRGRLAHAHPDSHVSLVIDSNAGRAQALATEFQCASSTTWESRPRDVDINAVIVATPHKYLAPVTMAALQDGSHVLCEKPLARKPDEALACVALASGSGLVLATGFNLRHHANVAAARRLVTQGAIGKLMYLRARYGHGGRRGYEKEWRGNPEMAGGGELLDQGIHLLDLSRWFLGELEALGVALPTSYWPVAPLEDNAFALLGTKNGLVAMLHASWTQWKNLFSLELYGSTGYLIADGLGGSYGPERLMLGSRRDEEPVPTEEFIVLESVDSWLAEWEQFLAAVRDGTPASASGDDGWRALTLAADLYRAATLSPTEPQAHSGPM